LVGADGLGGTIGMNAAWDQKQYLIDHPVLAPAPVAPPTPFKSTQPSPAQLLANRLAIAKNPRAAQTAKNNRF
jgi:hypothetical protein